ncbi:diguanylate cyclase [Dokdonella sp.]|uniref:diguanylate cyclase n=1 Tax=Dokdonella sp. TaxID=2291710 RepID=UPI0035283283
MDSQAPRYARYPRAEARRSRQPGLLSDCGRRFSYAGASLPSSDRMTVASQSPRNNDHTPPLRTRAQTNLPRRAYPFRILGMGLASLPLMVVMHELDASWLAWVWILLTCLVWPHLAYRLAMRSSDPFKAELRNFIVDSAFAGSWVPMLQFNLLPSAVLLTVVFADKINTGVRGLWVWSLPGMLLALVVGAWLNDFAFQPESGLWITLSCLPILVIHTLAVSASSSRLVRRVQLQNRKLEELSRVDTLTGLYSRGHWESLAASVLQDRAAAADSTLMVLDVDRFKEINDEHGHSIGDDVLRGIADLVRRNLPTGSHAGRLGGDEFAAVMPFPLVEAESAAERIRAAVHQLQFASASALRCTVSIGIAGAPDAGSDLRSWTEAADRALYRAKQTGRNRAAVA